MKLKYRRPLIVLAVMLLCLLLHSLPVSKQLLEILKLRSYDLILDIFNAHSDRDSQPVIEDVVIVDIDEESISRLGQFSSWPSLYFADLVDSLANDAPVLIAFDVFFTESDSLNAYGRQRLTEHLKAQGFNPRSLLDHLSGDLDFARALSEAGNAYLGMFNSSASSPVNSLPANLKAWRVPGMPATPVSNPKAPTSLLADAVYGIGFAHIEPDISGIIHDYPLFFRYEDMLYVNFSFQACLDLLGIDQIRRDGGLRLLSDGSEVMKLPLDARGKFFLNYYGKSHRFRYISFSDVLFGRIEDGFFADKIVLVGSSAAGLRDIKSSPLQTDYPGVELHATMMMNLLEGDFVHWLPQWLTWLISLILLVLVSLSIRYLKPLQSLTIFVLSSGLLFFVFILSFSIHRLSLDYSVIMLPWLLGYLSLQVHESQLQYSERKKVRNAFEHYVSKSVISQIMKVNDPLRVGGIRCQAAILFCDIRSFSTICEKLPAEAVSDFLHEHFNRCTRVVTEHYGTLDKYIGDALLALFNVPLPKPDYCRDACLAALGIIAEADRLQGEYASHPTLSSFRVGVGIASGEIIAGNFGSDEIFNYTGIGDRMNLASRLESLNKVYLSSIIIDAATYEAVKEHFLCRHLDRVCVKGKGEPIDIYELLCPINAASPALNSFCAAYDEAVAALIAGNKDCAAKLFGRCLIMNPEDYPSHLMLHRMKDIDWQCWDGIWRFENK